MANRAYLFSSDADPDDVTTWVRLDRNSQRYYDSRHAMPLSWFFFFQPEDVKMLPVISGDSAWEEVKFMANKRVALQRFQEKEPLLAKVVGPLLYTDAFSCFLPALRDLPGSSLCLDPDEVMQEEDEDEARRSRHILQLIGSASPDLAELEKALSFYSYTKYEDIHDAVGKVVGHSYW